MRKRSKNKATIDKADRSLQDAYRRKYKRMSCEVCGRRFEVVHHHLEKSKSNAGRYFYRNLIFLCFKCHARLHFGDNNIIAIYSTKRGRKWVLDMIELKKVKRPAYSKKELEGIINKYSKWKPKKEQPTPF